MSMSLGVVTQHWIVHRVLDKGILPVLDTVVWDPLCGEGHITEVLRRREFKVLATDTVRPKWEACDGVDDLLAVDNVDPSIKLICTRLRPEQCGNTQWVEHALDLMDLNDGAVLLLAKHSLDANPLFAPVFDKLPFAAKFVCVGDEQLAWYYWDWRYDATPGIHYISKRKGG
jgi:hypothetical protein